MVAAEAGLDSSGIRETIVKHLLAAAALAVALGLVASCGTDDFGLSAETRSGIDSNWEAQSAFEQAATCEQLQSPSERLKASESLQEKMDPDADILDADNYGGYDAKKFREDKVSDIRAQAEGMVSYLEAKC